MAQSQRLRRDAERCYRLAQGTADPKLAGELEAIAHEFEREAAELEEERRPLAA